MQYGIIGTLYFVVGFLDYHILYVRHMWWLEFNIFRIPAVLIIWLIAWIIINRREAKKQGEDPNTLGVLKREGKKTAEGVRIISAIIGIIIAVVAVIVAIFAGGGNNND